MGCLVCPPEPFTASYDFGIEVRFMMSTVTLDPRRAEEHLSNEVVSQHLQLYEDYFQSILEILGQQISSWPFTSS